MKMWGSVTLAGALASCGRLGFDPNPPSVDASVDAIVDGRAALQCEPWSTPTPIAVASTVESERSPMLSGDGLTLMWNLSGREQISRRATRGEAFAIANVVPSLTDIPAFDQTFTSNGLEFIYSVSTDPSCPLHTRTTVAFQFDQPREMYPQLCTLGLTGLALVGDGRVMYSNSVPNGGYGQVFRSNRATTSELFSSATVVPGLPDMIGFTSVRPDELELFFETPNPNQVDMFVTTRAATTDSWGPPVALSFNEAAFDDEDPAITDDGTELVFASNRPGAGAYDLYVVTRTCR